MVAQVRETAAPYDIVEVAVASRDENISCYNGCGRARRRCFAGENTSIEAIMKKVLTDLMLGAGVRIFGTRLQNRGRIASFSVLRDADGIRAVIYEDGTQDSVRRREDGQEAVIIQGKGITAITRDAEGLLTAATAFESIADLPDAGIGAGLDSFDMFTSDATAAIPNPLIQMLEPRRLHLQGEGGIYTRLA